MGSTPGVPRYLLRRFVLIVPTLVLASAVLFALMEVIPGDIADLMVPFDPEHPELYKLLRQQIRQEYGLDKPTYLRYTAWILGAIRGDLGYSIIWGQPVTSIIMNRLPVSLILAATSLVVMVAIAIPAGVISATRKGKVDMAISVTSFIGVGIPSFWLALIFLIVFAVWLHVFPMYGYAYIEHGILPFMQRMIIPAIVSGLVSAAYLIRITRASMLEVLAQDYIIAARSKGLAERIIIYRHALKNAMIPVVTVVGLFLAHMVGGNLILEVIFMLPGVGNLTVQGILNRDRILVEGVVMVFVLWTALANLIIDLTYTYIDPRIRYG